jgi:hypothetical protein
MCRVEVLLVLVGVMGPGGLPPGPVRGVRRVDVLFVVVGVLGPGDAPPGPNRGVHGVDFLKEV